MSDLPTLSGPSHPPASGGPPRQLVVLLHGVGADGSDLIGLAPYIAPALPDAEFLSPDAPEPFDMAPFGRQWFSIREIDDLRRVSGVEAARIALVPFLREALEARGLGWGDLALVGFSQGTMTALHAALRLPVPPAAVVGFSGMLVAPDRLEDEMTAKPPILLIHGDADTVVPVAATQAAGQHLAALGLAVATMIRPGLGHSIDAEGLTAAVRFLVERFNAGATVAGA